jgi:mRNA interferase RelE/StbE
VSIDPPTYIVIVDKNVHKQLLLLPKKFLAPILEKIRSLGHNPYPKGCKKLSTTDESYQVRYSDYRIVYRIDSEAHQVIISGVRHRKEVYR